MISFVNYTSLKGKEKSLGAKKTISDFKSLLNQANRAKEIIRDCVNRRATTLALEESKKSIQMAHSIKALTQLAFIFIPLTFSVSLFGTNLRTMGSGTVSLWAFFLTVVAISAATTFIWGLYTDRIQQHLRGPVGFPARYPVIMPFASRSPLGAFILLLYSISHSGTAIDNMLLGLGLMAILHQSGKPYNIPHYNYRPARKGTPLWRAFWKKRIHQVYLFVREGDWQHNYLHRRIISRFKRARPQKDERNSQEA